MLDFSSLEAIIVWIMLGVSGVGAWYDIKTRKIPHFLTFGGMGLLFLILLRFGSNEILMSHIIGWMGGVIVGIGGFALGIWGGGDGKMFMFLSLAVGYENGGLLLFWVLCCGGVEGLFFFLLKRDLQMQIPYGVALFMGAFMYVLVAS